MKFGNQISKLGLLQSRGIHISEYIPAYHLKYTRFPIKPKREFPYWIPPSNRLVYPFTKEIEFKPTQNYELVFKTAKPALSKKQRRDHVNKYQNLFDLLKTMDKPLIFQAIRTYQKKGDLKPFLLGINYLELSDVLQLQSQLKIQPTKTYYSLLLHKYRNHIFSSKDSDNLKLEKLQEMTKLLEKIRFECFSKPEMSDILLVLECTIHLRQDPQELFKQVLTEYQPVVSFFILFLDYFHQGSPIDLISTCRNYHVLHSNAIQLKILEIISKQESGEILSKSLEFVSILKRLNIKVTEETLNHVLKLYSDPKEALEFIKINNFRIYTKNVKRLLHMNGDQAISTELWPRASVNKKLLSLFIRYCSTTRDFHTLVKIADSVSDKEQYVELLDGLMEIDSPLETVRVWKQSNLLQHEKSWKWLLLSINSRNTMPMFTDIVTELLLHGPPIPTNLSEILVLLLQRIGESDLEKQELLLEHVKEMALFHQDMENII